MSGGTAARRSSRIRLRHRLGIDRRGRPQVESSISLAGLGMGPLGGSGSTAGAISSAPTIQVALNAPSAGSPTSSTIAVSLVTLTQMFSWSHDGQEIKPEEPPTPPDAEASTPTTPPVDASAAAEVGPPAGPLDGTRGRRRRADERAGPANGLAIRIDPPPITPAAAEPAPSDGAFTLRDRPRRPPMVSRRQRALRRRTGRGDG